MNKRTVSVIALCFLLVSMGYLAWSYRLMELMPSGVSDGISLVAAYLIQAAGIGLFAFFSHKKKAYAERSLFVVLILHMVCLFPAVRGTSLVAVLVAGLLLNLFCGWISGYYLYRLTEDAGAATRASTLGVGYCLAIIASWLFSLAGYEAFYGSGVVLAVCFGLTVAVFFSAGRRQENVVRETGAAGGDDSGRDKELQARMLMQPSKEDAYIFMQLPKKGNLTGFLILAGVVVLLFSTVNSSGFGFPSADLKEGISLEFTRLFYAVGIIIAGFVNDRNRKYGGICALAAMVIPFIILALNNESVPLMVFWIISYFAFGFYTVYRIILFSDIAAAGGMIMFAGAGLLSGRIGDAAGEGMHLILSGHSPVLLAAAAAVFIAAVILFFRLYHILYMPAQRRQKSEQEIFDQFAARNDLSARERDVLRLLLLEQTTAQIAENLFISESTAKFHIHNILQKTGCKNRVALRSLYTESRE